MSIFSGSGHAKSLSWRCLSLYGSAVHPVSVLIFLLFASAAAYPAELPSTPLTLDAALQVAEAHSHALQAQDAATRSSRELAISAGRLPDPVLRLSVDNLPVEGDMRYSLTDDFMTMRSVELMQTYASTDKRRARGAVFEREADAAQAMRTLQLVAVRQGTARAWFDRYYQQRRLDLLVGQRWEAMLQAEAVETAYGSGRAMQADVFLMRALVARLDDSVQEVRAELVSADQTLARWVGDAVTFALAEPPRIDQLPPTVDQALAHQLDQHPDIVLMAARESMALAEAEVARQEKNADWTWSLMYSQRGPDYDDMMSLGVSVPLQWDHKNRQGRELAARRAKAEQLRAETEELRRERAVEVQRMLVNWRSNLTRLRDYDRTLIPLTAARIDAANAAYRSGTAQLAEALEARRSAIDTRLERLRIEMQTAFLWAALAFLVPASAEPTGQHADMVFANSGSRHHE